MGKPSAIASAQSRAQVERRRNDNRVREMISHKRRCSALPPPTTAQIEAMLAEYRARGGEVTACPDAYALPVQNGAGRDAGDWTL